MIDNWSEGGLCRRIKQSFQESIMEAAMVLIVCNYDKFFFELSHLTTLLSRQNENVLTTYILIINLEYVYLLFTKVQLCFIKIMANVDADALS